MRQFFIIFLLVTTFCQAYSQYRGDKNVYTLKECLDIAKQKNYDIQLARQQAESSAAQVTGAFGNYLPSVSFNMSYQRNLNETNTIDVGGQPFEYKALPNSYTMRATARLDIFDGFNREAQYSRAQTNYESYSLLSKHTLQRVEIEVYSYYIDVIRNYKVLEIQKENLELGKKQLERIQAQYEAGLVPVSNVYAQEAELGNRELELVRAENDLNKAKADLLTAMGLLPDSEVDFEENSIDDEVEESEIVNFRKKIGSYSSGALQALENRLDYKASSNNVDAAQSGVTIAASGYYPSLTAFGGWSWQDNYFDNFDNGNSSLSLSLSVPIFENFRSNANIQNAKLQVTQAETDKNKLEQSIRNSVKTSYLNLETAEKQMDITERTLKSSKQNYESTKEMYNLGSANITELLTANNQLVLAQVNRITAVYGYLRAQKALLYAIGNL